MEVKKSDWPVLTFDRQNLSLITFWDFLAIWGLFVCLVGWLVGCWYLFVDFFERRLHFPTAACELSPRCTCEIYLLKNTKLECQVNFTPLVTQNYILRCVSLLLYLDPFILLVNNHVLTPACLCISRAGEAMPMIPRCVLISQHRPEWKPESDCRTYGPASVPYFLLQSKGNQANLRWRRAHVNTVPPLIKSSGSPALLCFSDCAPPAVIIKAKPPSKDVFYFPHLITFINQRKDA